MIFKPAPLRKRLWQAGGAVAVLVATFAAGNFFLADEKAVTSRMLGHDFLAFYTAGSLARHGQFQRMYDFEAARQVQQAIAVQEDLELGAQFAPYWNPPFYAWLAAPLTTLPFADARAAWTWINLACLAMALFMLARMLPRIVAHPPLPQALSEEPVPVKFGRDWRNWALVPLLVCVSMPAVQAVSHGQNTFMSLLLLTVVVTAWRARMPVSAGLACGLMFYKPQLAAVVAAMMVLDLGPRVCLGMAFMAGTLLLTTAITMPGAMGNYLYQLPLNLQAMQIDSTYLWERHATLRAFWRLLLQGRGAGETSSVVSLLTMASTGLICLGLIGAWWRMRRCGTDDCWTGETRSIARDRLITATLLAMPLVMPFYFDYDLLLVSVAAVLFAGEILAMPPGSQRDTSQRLLCGTWMALYGWLMINPPIAAASGVNVTVVLLATVCGLSIVRACHRGTRITSVIVQDVQRVIARRAA